MGMLLLASTLILVCICTGTSTFSAVVSSRPSLHEYAPKIIQPAVNISSRNDIKSCSSCILHFSKKYYPDSLFFHLHIPKTGGASFVLCLMCWDRASLTNGCGEEAMTKMHDEENTISCEIATSSRKFGLTLTSFLGHLSRPDVKIITFIRKPIDHVISAFLHMKHHHETPACRSFDAIFESYAAHSKSLRPLHGDNSSRLCMHYDIRNMQTSALTLSPSTSVSGDGFTNITSAVSLLSKSVFFFGITEHYRASLCLLAYQLGQLSMHTSLCDCSLMQPESKVMKANAAAMRSSQSVLKDEITIEAMKTLEQSYINLDNVLHNIAVQLFLQRLLIAERESGMKLLCEATDGSEVMILKASISNPHWNNHM